MNLQLHLISHLNLLQIMLTEAPFDHQLPFKHKQKPVILDKNIPEMPYSVGLTWVFIYL